MRRRFVRNEVLWLRTWRFVQKVTYDSPAHDYLDDLSWVMLRNVRMMVDSQQLHRCYLDAMNHAYEEENQS